MSKDESGHDKLWAMIKKHRFAMMTTQHEGNVLRSRPMTTIERRDDQSLWFFAKSDSAVTAALAARPQACLSYANPADHDFVSVAGPAAIVSDVAKKKELWGPMVQAWLPEGPEASSVVLLEVKPDHAEYWDTKSSKLVQLFSMVRSLATGQPPRDMGEHRDVPVGSSKVPGSAG